LKDQIQANILRLEQAVRNDPSLSFTLINYERNQDQTEEYLRELIDRQSTLIEKLGEFWECSTLYHPQERETMSEYSDDAEFDCGMDIFDESDPAAGRIEVETFSYTANIVDTEDGA
jgi:hypothetical protein